MFDGFKHFFGSRFNVKKWIGYNHLKDTARFIKTGYEEYSPFRERERIKKRKKNLSFEEMMQLHQMTEADVAQQIKLQYQAAWAYGVIGLFPLIYSFFVFRSGVILGGVLCWLVTALIWAYAFRARVAWYQLTHRRFLVSLKEVLLDLFSFKTKQKG